MELAPLKGTNAHWGTQLATSNIISRRSSSSILLDILSGSLTLDTPPTPSPSNFKHKLSPFDISGASSSSKRQKASEGVAAIKEFSGILDGFGGVVNKYIAHAPHLTQPPPLPLPPPPPSSPPHSTHPEHLDEAIKHILESDKISRDSGNMWLSDEDIVRVIAMFEDNPDLAKTYLTVAHSAHPNIILKWIKMKLSQSVGGSSSCTM
jgi:hypothetical protein